MKLHCCFGGAACAGLALVAVLCIVKPAKADTIVEDFTVSGTAVRNASGLDGITSSSFGDFNTAVGTLTGVTLSFAGTANYSEPITAGDIVDFLDVTTASNVLIEIFSGQGGGFGGNFSISANGTVSDAEGLSLFEGSGTQALMFDFLVDVGTVTMSGQSGTLTYDFTSAVAAVPEPSTWAMMIAGFGLLGLLGYRNTRNALA